LEGGEVVPPAVGGLGLFGEFFSFGGGFFFGGGPGAGVSGMKGDGMDSCKTSGKLRWLVFLTKGNGNISTISDKKH
jgi:hypothetical protein